jgi:hypothetical protein
MPRDVPEGADVVPPAGDPWSGRPGRADFAARLSELRVQAGSPSFRNLAKVTNYSSSSLADATSGRRLPSEAVVRALVEACGADPAPWLAELRRIAVAEKAARSADAPEAGGPGTGASGASPGEARPRAEALAAAPGRRLVARRTPQRRLAWRDLMALGAGALVIFGLGAAVGRITAPAGTAGSARPAAVVQRLPNTPSSGAVSPAPSVSVPDSTDPVAGHCTADARLVDKAPMLRGRTQIGTLELEYSPACRAGWARIYLNPGHPTMMGEAIIRSDDGRIAMLINPLEGTAGFYSGVITPGPHGCLGADGVLWQQEKPDVTASIPCERPTA